MYRTTLKIEGMMCNMCEAHVNDAVRNRFKVKSVKSSHKNGETVIESAEPLDEEAIKEAIADTGYTITGIETEEFKKKGLFGR
ncbi:MAG: cation transporter [Lachnospiraceae bacterium]|nr:cation transporter [Lachnospiraceae bacterium]